MGPEEGITSIMINGLGNSESASFAPVTLEKVNGTNGLGQINAEYFSQLFAFSSAVPTVGSIS